MRSNANPYHPLGVDAGAPLADLRSSWSSVAQGQQQRALGVELAVQAGDAGADVALRAHDLAYRQRRTQAKAPAP